MDTPSTLLGVLGAGIVLILTILKWIGDANDLKLKKKEAVDAEIDKIDNADDAIRMANRMRDK